MCWNLYDNMYQILHISSSFTLSKWIEIFIQLSFSWDIFHLTAIDIFVVQTCNQASFDQNVKYCTPAHNNIMGDRKIAMHLPPGEGSFWSPLEFCIGCVWQELSLLSISITPLLIKFPYHLIWFAVNNFFGISRTICFSTCQKAWNPLLFGLLCYIVVKYFFLDHQ